MTDLGRNAIRRSRKDERRRNRKRKRAGVAVGVAAMATVAAVGAGQAIGPGQAQAAPTIDDVISDVVSGALGGSSGLDQLGDLKDGLMAVVNGGGSDVAEQWRIQLCGSGGQTGGADCTRSTGVGLAIVAPGRIELVPTDLWPAASGVYNVLNSIDLLDVIPPLRDPEEPVGSATIIGSGFQFAFATTGGNATAVSYLPVSLATAGASDGRTAYALALVGMANAWTTDEVTTSLVGIELPISLPGIEHVSCYGGLTGAYAEGVGACANILGTFDFRWKAPNNEVQFGLTDPTGILFDPETVLGNVITAVITNVTGDGDLPITLSKDFGRLSFGGDYDLGSGNFVRWTSDYGTQAPTTVEWLGQKVTFNPWVTVNGVQRPNHIGAPVIEFGALDSGEIVPIIHFPDVELPFGLPGPSAATTATTSLRTAATFPESAEPATAATGARSSDVSDDAAVGHTTSDDGSDAGGYVGTHRATESSAEYVGKHRSADADSPSMEAAGSTDSSATDSSSGDSGSRATGSDAGGSDTGASITDSSESGSGADASDSTSSGSSSSGSSSSGSSSSESGTD
ncbi:hypothetical protein QSJ19_23680 [Gordonia sp. ABSL11-1]|uniref:hypothetical protein n=1 Tax=Gordonia sp. ABSL11-1 TaxID=3053924 RepID=UPI0025748BE9|nr:hypothetical protein [Gordonia sp. ABSL11-1]MDL9948529.1 hypothetical protein [Gordonia sp. ABSL11-1]